MIVGEQETTVDENAARTAFDFVLNTLVKLQDSGIEVRVNPTEEWGDVIKKVIETEGKLFDKTG